MSLAELPTRDDYERSSIYYENDPQANHQFNYTGEEFAFTQDVVQYFDALKDPEEPGNQQLIQEFEAANGSYAELTECSQQLTELASSICAEVVGQIPQKLTDTEQEMFAKPYESVAGLKPLGRQLEYLILRTIFEHGQSYAPDKSRLEFLIEQLSDEDKTTLPGTPSSLPTKHRLSHVVVSEMFEIYGRDVPIYEKVYEAFDELRDAPEKPYEVYLGRDGVYAYHGRRAQAVVRKMMDDPEQRAKLKDSGELDDLAPDYSYFVYNRPMDHASRETATRPILRKYIDEADISPDTNPHFFDTGFAGSIPYGIMRLMGFSEEEMKGRIHLLNSSLPENEIPGVQVSRGDVLNIEDNEKSEHSALGIRSDPATGEIKHVAQAMKPLDQLHFLVAREVLLRHFWITEKEKPKQSKGSRLRKWLLKHRNKS